VKLERITRAPGEGKAVPLVFVHGAWHGAWCWDEFFLPYFAERGYQSHAFSLRGHGKSERSRSLRTTRIDHYVEDLASVVESLEAPPVLIGHSMGGLVVQRYLEGRDLPGAVLLAPDPVGGVLGATLRMAARHPAAFLRANLGLRLWPIVATPELARDAFFPADMSEADSDRYWSRLQDESYLAYLDMMVFRLPRPGRVTTPILVVGGEADRIFSIAEMRKTAVAYGGDPVMIPGAAHDLMLDPRWQQAADAILDWLAGRGL
jgi:pimeloyl-ACP methyl ester carboxylesterase